MTPQKPVMRCPRCGALAPATVPNWNQQRWARELAEEGSEDLSMGAQFRQDDPGIRFFRRVRRCSNCEGLFGTAEVPEELIWELADYRALVSALDADASRAEGAARALRRKLKNAKSGAFEAVVN